MRAFTAKLSLDRVVVHGWSLGGLVAVLFADLEPHKVERLILVDPALPGPLTPGQLLGWHTLGRLALVQDLRLDARYCGCSGGGWST